MDPDLRHRSRIFLGMCTCVVPGGALDGSLWLAKETLKEELLGGCSAGALKQAAVVWRSVTASNNIKS